MTILQLNPPIEVFLDGKGYGWAICLIDYGPGINGCFLIALESGAFLYNDVTQCQCAENFAYGFNKKPSLPPS
jgi:hypothetical protein